ncbi:MAG: FtsX-like permease family protein [Bacteroidia bacterium]|nr:FtsX-like permease family protein [Bacteroidia bacterium]
MFNVFSYTFLEGNPSKALVEPNSIVLTEHLAKKLFGNEPALNKVLYVDQGGAGDDFHVTAVIRDEMRSHIHANFFVSMTSSGWGEYIRSDEANGEWAGQNFMPSYVRLVPGANLDNVIAKMNDVLQRHGGEDLKAMGFNKTLRLEPVKDIYLKSSVGQSPRIIYTYVIVSIAVFILLLACINFMNLSTAKAAKRAGEIGVRKVMGAFRSTLIKQLMGETLLIVIVSLLISVVMVQLALPFFNELTEKHIAFGSNNMLYIGLALIAIAIITGVAAGSYPAFYISSFQPAQVLKGKFDQLKSSGWLRRGLVVFQFMIAITLVCGMLIISRQLTYIQEKNLGFDASAKIVLPMRTVEAHEKYESLKQALGGVSTVNDVSGANYIPGSFIFSDGMFYPDGSSMDNAVRTFRNYVDAHYMELLEIKLLAGRTFSDNRSVEQNTKVIINRKAAEEFGFTIEGAIGQHVYTDWQGTRYDQEIVGVMEDFHQTTLKENILPMMLAVPENGRAYDFILLDVQPEDFKRTIASIETKWKEQVNNTPFEYTFLDESISKQYNEDRRVSAIITTFTIIAMLISALACTDCQPTWLNDASRKSA